MSNRLWAFGALSTAMLLGALPAVSQTIQLGRDGIHVVPQNRDQSDEDARSQDRRSNERDPTDISERQAVRIAKGEGLSDVDSITKKRRSYRIVGTDRDGDDILVDINRQTGEVLDVR